MSSTTTRDVTVQELSKFGFKENDTYVNWSKNIKESDKGKVVPGGTYNMEVFTADSGKEYVNKVLATAESALRPKSVTPKVAAKPVHEKPASISNGRGIPAASGLSKEEWASKDRRISRQGCIQVAVQVAATFDEAVVLADKMLLFVNA